MVIETVATGGRPRKDRARMNGIESAAERVRARVQSARETAEIDQSGREFADAFATLGLDLSDPRVAGGAHAMCQIFHYRMVDECQEIEMLEPALLKMGAHIQEALASTALYVR